jgi:hypothetical protein
MDHGVFRCTTTESYCSGAEALLADRYQSGWRDLAARFPGVALHPVFASLQPQQLVDMELRALQHEPNLSPGALTRYFRVDVPDGANRESEALLEGLLGWAAVEHAEYDRPTAQTTVFPADDTWFASGTQGHLSRAPLGIGAACVWPTSSVDGYAGGAGEGQRLIDVETGWDLTHEDLPASIKLIHGTNQLSGRPHGTRVLGVVCALDSDKGVLGVAPQLCWVGVSSCCTKDNCLDEDIKANNVADAISVAASYLCPGDVILIQRGAVEASFGGPPSSSATLPAEVVGCVFDVIQQATAQGIVVVEAAGNLGTDLDTYGCANLASGARGTDKDSGAIVVGGATCGLKYDQPEIQQYCPNGTKYIDSEPALSVVHERIVSGTYAAASNGTYDWGSNYGDRVDCYAWGERVGTCRPGTKYKYDTGFDGTSAAAAIIAGAALVVQGISQANQGIRFEPGELRDLLSDPALGTESSSAADRIGSMPDLEKIALKLVPPPFFGIPIDRYEIVDWEALWLPLPPGWLVRPEQYNPACVIRIDPGPLEWARPITLRIESQLPDDAVAWLVANAPVAGLMQGSAEWEKLQEYDAETRTVRLSFAPAGVTELHNLPMSPEILGTCRVAVAHERARAELEPTASLKVNDPRKARGDKSQTVTLSIRSA